MRSVLLSLLIVLALPGPAAAEQWHVLETPQVTVMGNVSPGRLREAALHELTHYYPLATSNALVPF